LPVRTSLLRRRRRANPRHLWKRFAVAILLVFGVTTAVYLAALHTASAARDGARMVALGEDQRLLSQRLLVEAEAVARGGADAAAARAALSAAARRFEANHRALVSSDGASLGAEAAAILRGDGRPRSSPGSTAWRMPSRGRRRAAPSG
jgi:hypothetical protein